MEETRKRKRAPNYTSREREVLLSIIQNYKNIVENKKTDGVSVDQKNKAWFEITQKFNSISPNSTFRSTESLKKYFENLKEDLRKRAGDDKRSLYKTGGGPPSPKLIADDDLLLDIVNKKTIFGLNNNFDSDATEDAAVNNGHKISIGKGEEAKKVDEERNNTGLYQGLDSISDIEIVYEEPVETTGIAEDRKTEENKNEEPNQENWAKASIDSIRKPLSTSLRQNLTKVYATSRKEDDKVKRVNNKHKRSNIRRPTTIRVLSSSVLAEKYSSLIDKKLELADCFKKESEMRMKILNFNIALKKKELHASGYTDADVSLLESVDLML